VDKALDDLRAWHAWAMAGPGFRRKKSGILWRRQQNLPEIPVLPRLCIVVLCLIVTPALADRADSPQQFADIGELRLVSGELLLDTRIGYRTAGTLNGGRSNVIVFPTWFTGTSGDLLLREKIGPGKLADSDRYYVIAIDSLGNGVSSSPSNSKRQPGAAFPALAIDDMVNAAHALLSRHLGIDHARAVMGISMGGMQTFQWLWQYPDFMDKAVTVDGSPRMGSYDLLQWQTHETAIELLHENGAGNAQIMRLLASLNLLTLWTPDYFVENVGQEALPRFLGEFSEGYARMDAYDYLVQLRAMIAHDVFADGAAAGRPYAESIRASLLVVGVASDQMVNPAAGKALAEQVGARYARIDSNCGHLGSSCEGSTVAALVNAFLE
jgi:homoserine O-acetyltransferase